MMKPICFTCCQVLVKEMCWPCHYFQSCRNESDPKYNGSSSLHNFIPVKLIILIARMSQFEMYNELNDI